MENKIIVFADGMYEKISASLNRLGYFDARIFCDHFDDCVELCEKARECEKTVVICENAQIDTLVEKVKKEGDEFELVDEQALILKNDNCQILLLPLELPFDNFLERFLGERSVFVCSVFGKGRAFVKNIFEGYKITDDISYEIITKSQFLHTIYYSKELNKEDLQNSFGDALFAYSDEGIECACGQIIDDKEIAIAETVTAGEIAARLAFYGKAKIKSLDICNESNAEMFNISSTTLEEKGFISKEVAFGLAKQLLKNSDLALSVVADRNGKVFVAVGKKEEIHVFSAVFEGESVKDNIVNFALFRLLRFFD